jgi:hypothetical protein
MAEIDVPPHEQYTLGERGTHPMTDLTISLPEALRQFVDDQVTSGHYGTASEYIQALILQAQRKKLKKNGWRPYCCRPSSHPAAK